MPGAVGRVVGGAHGPPGLEHGAGEPGRVPRVEVGLLVVAPPPVAHAQDHPQPVVLLVEQDHRHAADLEDAGDLLVDGVEQPALIELAGHRLRQLVQHRELLDPALVVAEEARVLERDARLARHRLHQPHLGLAEIAGRVPPAGHEAADHLLLGQDRHEEQRAGRRRPPHRLRDAEVVGRVGRDHRLAAAGRLAEEGVVVEADAHVAERGERLRRHVIARERGHPLPVLFEQPHPRGVGAKAVGHVAEELAGERVEIEGGGEGLAHREEGLGLLQLLLGLPRQVRVLHAEADLGRHALDQAHLGLGELAAGPPPHQEDRAHRLPAHGGRREQHRVGRDPLQRLRVEAGIGVGVAAPGRPAGPPRRHQVREAREGEVAGGEPLEQLLGHVIAGQRARARRACRRGSRCRPCRLRRRSPPRGPPRASRSGPIRAARARARPRGARWSRAAGPAPGRRGPRWTGRGRAGPRWPSPGRPARARRRSRGRRVPRA